VTIEPGDQMAAGPTGRGHLRASDADREQVVDALKAAFVQGRLSQDELHRRVGEALQSRTYAGLAMLTADISAKPAEPAPVPKAAAVPAGKPVSTKTLAWAGVIAVLPVLGAAFLTYYGGFIVLFLFAFIGYTVTGKA
jgi:hypothetical protein